MAVTRPRDFAGKAEVPVYAAIGRDALERIEDLSICHGVRLVATPRQASILLAAGEMRPGDREALYRLHDQLPHPRATLWWVARAADDIARSVTLPTHTDPLPALQDLQRQLQNGQRPSETHLLPDEPPAPWRGRGDHGQGGEGMMGGTPYGRPLAMPGEDIRDGLMLDAFTMRIGPFMPQLPPGLVLEVTLQGDVVQDARIIRPPLPVSAVIQAPFRRAQQEAVPIIELERARAAHHLRCIARLLVLLQLAPQAERFRRAARDVANGKEINFGRLQSLLRLTGVFQAIPPGLGRFDLEVAEALGGTPLRAAGQASDTRQALLTYRKNRFHPLTRKGSDVRARLSQWLAETEQSLRLIAVAAPDDRIESQEIETPWGSAAQQAALEYRFTQLLPGLEWQEAMLVIASFDIASMGRMSAVVDRAPVTSHPGSAE